MSGWLKFITKVVTTCWLASNALSQYSSIEVVKPIIIGFILVVA